MGGLQAKSMTSQRNPAVRRWRICVTMATLWQQQDGGYALLWKRYDNNDVFYIFNSTVIDWTWYTFYNVWKELITPGQASNLEDYLRQMPATVYWPTFSYPPHLDGVFFRNMTRNVMATKIQHSTRLDIRFTAPVTTLSPHRTTANIQDVPGWNVTDFGRMFLKLK